MRKWTIGGCLKLNQFPRARPDCLSRKLDKEVVVYDPQRHRGHCLNCTAAAVWKLCDGKSNASQIAKALSRHLSAQVDQQIVDLALQQLAHARLLVKPKHHPQSPSRRAAIR